MYGRVVILEHQGIAITDAHGASDDQLAELDAMVGCRLPGSFREFWLVAAGGTVEYLVRGEAHDGNHSFSWILPGDRDATENIFETLTRWRRVDGFPQSYLPVAVSGGGSCLFLDVESGTVVASIRRSPSLETRWVRLADDFASYLQQLTPDREALLEHLEHDCFEAGDVDELEAWLEVAIPDWRAEPELSQAVERARRQVADE